jgi:hypothetical protein
VAVCHDALLFTRFGTLNFIGQDTQHQTTMSAAQDKNKPCKPMARAITPPIAPPAKIPKDCKVL